MSNITNIIQRMHFPDYQNHQLSRTQELFKNIQRVQDVLVFYYIKNYDANLMQDDVLNLADMKLLGTDHSDILDHFEKSGWTVLRTSEGICLPKRGVGQVALFQSGEKGFTSSSPYSIVCEADKKVRETEIVDSIFQYALESYRVLTASKGRIDGSVVVSFKGEPDLSKLLMNAPDRSREILLQNRFDEIGFKLEFSTETVRERVFFQTRSGDDSAIENVQKITLLIQEKEETCKTRERAEFMNAFRYVIQQRLEESGENLHFELSQLRDQYGQQIGLDLALMPDLMKIALEELRTHYKKLYKVKVQEFESTFVKKGCGGGFTDARITISAKASWWPSWLRFGF